MNLACRVATCGALNEPRGLKVWEQEEGRGKRDGRTESISESLCGSFSINYSSVVRPPSFPLQLKTTKQWLELESCLCLSLPFFLSFYLGLIMPSYSKGFSSQIQKSSKAFKLLLFCLIILIPSRTEKWEKWEKRCALLLSAVYTIIRQTCWTFLLISSAAIPQGAQAGRFS